MLIVRFYPVNKLRIMKCVIHYVVFKIEICTQLLSTRRKLCVLMQIQKKIIDIFFDVESKSENRPPLVVKIQRKRKNIPFISYGAKQSSNTIFSNHIPHFCLNTSLCPYGESLPPNPSRVSILSLLSINLEDVQSRCRRCVYLELTTQFFPIEY